MPLCTHLDQVKVAKPQEVSGCEDCQAIGGWWVHLRVCRTCGKVGCCDDSPNRHATHHANDSTHPIISSLELGEEWSYCYADDLDFFIDE
jgi:hypothetical protein